MTLLYHDRRFLDHQTGNHPECPERLRAIDELLESQGLLGRCQRPEWTLAPNHLLSRCHTQAHVQLLEEVAKNGGGNLDPDTVVSPKSFDVALLAAGAVEDAVTRVLAGEQKSGLCLVRPPGHHAVRENAMGFCLLNNIALGAQAAIDRGVERILIVDWDVHHGNGTQAIFYDDPRVGFFSVHRWPFYPGTGTAHETGTSAGLGTTCNLPLSIETTRREYHAAVARELTDFAAKIKPELVLVSAGFDAHRADPIGSLGLETGDFAELGGLVLDIANSYAEGRIVSVLEGGYNPPVLAECVAQHLKQLIAHEE